MGSATRDARARVLAVAVAAAVLVGLLPTLAAAQPAERGLDNACPEGVPTTRFTDIADNVHSAAIDCLALYAITHGTSASTYGPGGTVRRDQMASFVLRLLDIAGADLPTGAEQPHADVPADNVHATAIARLTALGVVEGFPDGTYQPAMPVRRDQMTAFLNRAFAVVAGEPLLSRQRFFNDTEGNPHRDDISALAAVGVAIGAGDGRFQPALPVRRDQMASFVMRLVDVLAEEGLLFTSVHLVTLDGYMVVDDTDPLAVQMGQGDPATLGYAFLGTHSGTGRLCYEISVLADGPFLSSHLRRAPMDATGRAVAQLGTPDDETGRADGCVLVDTAVLRDLEDRPSDFAVDVRTQAYPRGVARGQVGTRHRAVTMSGAFVPADDRDQPVRFGQGQTDATGVAVMQADVAAGRLCAYLAVDAAGPFTGAHIHRGAMHATGPPVLDLPVPGEATGEATGCVDADPAVLGEVMAHSDAFYVTVRTAGFPAGALRSQLGSGMLGIPLSGESVTDEQGEPGHGEPGAAGTAWLQADFDSGLVCFWLTTDATGPFTASHVVRAAPGRTGLPVVTLPTPDATTGQVSGCQMVDPAILADTAHVERYAFVIATEGFPHGAVRGQFADGLLF